MKPNKQLKAAQAAIKRHSVKRTQRKKFVHNSREHSGFSVVSNINNAIAAVQAEKDRIATIEEMTCRDLKTWVPGHVSIATAQIYNITKAEVAQIRSRKVTVENKVGMFVPNSSTVDVYKRQGRNAGKGNVRVSTNGAETIAGLVFTFKGAKHANWTTRAGKQSKVPKARKKIKKDGRKYSIPKPYVTTVETFKGQRTPITPKGTNRVFVMSGEDGKLRAMHIRPGDKRPMPHGSSSIPQAIMNKDVVAIWRPQMQAFIVKKLAHHDKQTAKGTKYGGTIKYGTEQWIYAANRGRVNKRFKRV